MNARKLKNCKSKKVNNQYCKLQENELRNETRLLKLNSLRLKNCKNVGCNNNKNKRYCKQLISELKKCNKITERKQCKLEKVQKCNQ